MSANTTTTPKLRYKDEVLDILVENDTLKVGQLEGIQELYTANVNETSEIYVTTFDNSMSDSSTNGVQNKVVKSYVDTSIQQAILDSWEGSY